MLTILRIFLVVLLLAGRCRAGEPRQIRERSAWTGEKVATVVGYRFQGPDGDPLSLISQAGLNAQQLKKDAVNSARLSGPQITTLLDATFSTTHRVGTSACYDPHHIFVFYARDGRPLRAIEVCFECATIVSTPGLSDQLQGHHDFVALARLASQLGLWSGGETVDEFADLMKTRELPKE